MTTMTRPAPAKAVAVAEAHQADAHDDFEGFHRVLRVIVIIVYVVKPCLTRLEPYCDQLGYLFVPVRVICRRPVPSRCIV